jgi:hypothetical protein
LLGQTNFIACSQREPKPSRFVVWALTFQLQAT